MNTDQKVPLTLAERIRLAEEGYDIYGREARIFPPPIAVDEKGQPLDWEKRNGSRDWKPGAVLTEFDYWGFAQARCPAPEILGYQKTI